jgi:hypothetical protein
MKVSDDSQI